MAVPTHLSRCCVPCCTNYCPPCCLTCHPSKTTILTAEIFTIGLVTASGILSLVANSQKGNWQDTTITHINMTAGILDIIAAIFVGGIAMAVQKYYREDGQNAGDGVLLLDITDKHKKTSDNITYDSF